MLRPGELKAHSGKGPARRNIAFVDSALAGKLVLKSRKRRRASARRRQRNKIASASRKRNS